MTFVTLYSRSLWSTTSYEDNWWRPDHQTSPLLNTKNLQSKSKPISRLSYFVYFKTQSSSEFPQEPGVRSDNGPGATSAPDRPEQKRTKTLIVNSGSAAFFKNIFTHWHEDEIQELFEYVVLFISVHPFGPSEISQCTGGKLKKGWKVVNFEGLFLHGFSYNLQKCAQSSTRGKTGGWFCTNVSYVITCLRV